MYGVAPPVYTLLLVTQCSLLHINSSAVETDGERQRWLAALESITSCSERERSDGEDEEEEGKGEREDNCER